MLGLGVSSYIELGRAYHQNVKTLKEYYDHISLATLPTLKTHLLSETEQKTRKTIKNLDVSASMR